MKTDTDKINYLELSLIAQRSIPGLAKYILHIYPKHVNCIKYKVYLSTGIALPGQYLYNYHKIN